MADEYRWQDQIETTLSLWLQADKLAWVEDKSTDMQTGKVISWISLTIQNEWSGFDKIYLNYIRWGASDVMAQAERDMDERWISGNHTSANIQEK